MDDQGGRIARDSDSNETVKASLVMKIPVISSLYASKGKGNIIYDTITNSILASDGTSWSPAGAPVNLGGDVTGPIGANLITSLQGIPVQTPLLPNPLDVLKFDGVNWIASPASGALPAPLQSIANLVTTGNDMLYTVASDTYAVTTSSALGRGFLAYTTQGQQQTALGLTIGGSVQAHSTVLDSVVTTAGTTDQMIVSSGGVYTNVNTTSYGRGLLSSANQPALLTTLDAVTGRSALLNTGRVTTVNSSPGTITQTGVSIDGSNNITGLNNVTFGGTINTVTTTEFSQLANINATTISSSQWGFLGAMDQSVASSTAPTFNGATMNAVIDMTNHKIQNVTDPTLSQDAATKQYVDTVASTGAPPLEAAKYATAAILPNAPIYAYPTLTSTAGAGVALVVDGYTLVLADQTNAVRILVKDQATAANNGVYVVTSYGGGATPWQLTRSADFDNASVPIPAGTSIFVDIVPGLTNSATTWALGATVTSLLNPVIFVQIGGVPTFSAGTGIDAASLLGGTIALTNPVATSIGGTGANFSVNTGNVVVTGNATMTATKVAPSGAFVGTTDIQNVSNKTFTSSTITDVTNTVRATQLATTGADVVLTAGAPGSTGQVLTLSSPTTADWTSLPVTSSPSRTLFVYQGATNVSPNYSTLNAAVTAAVALVPTSSNWVKIEIFSGTYPEITPLYIPPFISLTGLTSAQSDVIIIPVAPAAVGAVLQSKGNVRVSGIVINGADGAGGFATIGYNSFYDATAPGTTDFLSNVTARNCTISAFSVNGNTVTPTQFSKILICKNCSAQVTTFPFTMTAGFDCSDGGVLSGTDINASGFFAGGINNITYGYRVDGDFSFMDLNVIQASSVVNGASIGGTVVSTSQGLYPTFRVNGGNFGFISTAGLLVNSKSVVRINDFKIQDDTGQFPTQKHAIVTNSPAASDPNYISAMYLNARSDLITLTTSGTPTVFVGMDLNENPANPANLFLCSANIGFLTNPAFVNVGGGAPTQLGMLVYYQTGGVYTNITSRVSSAIPPPAEIVDCATTVQIDLSSAPATIDGVTPTLGVTKVLVKNGSVANPVVSGYSVDNGVYIWNGTGNPLTRDPVFATGTQLTDKTWLLVSSGTVNYGSQWKFQGRIGGFNTGNITIGTTSINFQSVSAPAFVNTNGNAIYIGSAAPIQFPHIQLTLTALLTTSSALFTSVSVLSWEYWNGSSWITLPLMSVDDAAPYDNYGNYTFGYFDAIPPSDATITYTVHFGDIASTWATTTNGGTLPNGYWVRCTVLDAANIVQVPVITTVLVGTSHTRIAGDGFITYYGNARPIVRENFPPALALTTGTTGEVHPSSYRLQATSTAFPSVTADIAAVFNNCIWQNGVTSSATLPWQLPSEIDTSTPLFIRLRFINESSGVYPIGNVYWQLDYAFIISTQGLLADSAGIPTFLNRPPINVTTTTVATAGQIQVVTFPVDITGFIPFISGTQGSTIWMKISRLGSDGLDTYTGPIYSTFLFANYSKWANGIHYTAL